MRKILFLILIASVAIVIVITLILGKPHTPRIHVRQPVIDLGTVDELSRARKIEFHIKNRGKERLLLTKVQARCPCLDLRLNRTSLLQGQEAILTGTYRPVLRPGDWSDKILLYSNDPENPVTELLLKAYVELNCTVVPASIVIKNLERNESRKTELEILGASNDESFRILDISASTDAVKVLEAEEIAMIQRTQKRRWIVRLLITSRDLDTWEDTMTISTSSSKVPNLEVPIIVNQVPDFKITPRIVCLRWTKENLAPGANVEIIPNVKDMPLKISRINNPDWLVVTVDAASGDLIRLRLKASEEKVSKNGNKEGKVMVTFDGCRSTVRIPVLLFVQE